MSLYKIAQNVTDEVLGKGTYAKMNGFDPSKGETRVSKGTAKARKVKDKVAGYLEVGSNGRGEVAINVDYSTAHVDADSIGHFVFSVAQARSFARLLLKHAKEAEAEGRS